MSMFATTSDATARRNGHIVEFKAGKCALEPGDGPTKRKVVAERAKGLCFVKHSEDGLVHFGWKNRETNVIVEDVIIFPGEAVFKEVSGCPDGQVFCLKFNDPVSYRLFWVQEPNIYKNIVKKVNCALTRQTTSTRLVARGGDTERGINSEDAAVAEMIGNGAIADLGGDLDHAQLLQLLHLETAEDGPAGSATIHEGPRSSENDRNVNAPQAATLRRLADSLRPPPGNDSPGQRKIEVVDVVAQGNDISPPDYDAPVLDLGDIGDSPEPLEVADAQEHDIDPGQMEPPNDQPGASADIKEGDIKRELKEEDEEDSVKEPEAKRGKPDDQMDMD